MLLDIDGTPIPSTIWHGTSADLLPTHLSPASQPGGWWNVIDHDCYLNPQFDEGDEDQRAELRSELRMAYGNTVFEAFKNSNDPELRAIAQQFGLDALGNEVSLLFVTDNLAYAERYGAVVEVDLDADGVLAVIPDDNIVEERGAWMLVLRAGSPFPLVPSPKAAATGLPSGFGP